MPFWRRALAWLGTAVAGFMLLIAGLLKALDPAGFAEQIALDVPCLARAAAPLAVAGVAFEIVLGLALLLGFRRRWVLITALLLVGLFIAVTVPKIGDPEAASCGCFGNFVVRTPLQTVVEDLIMAGGLLLGFVGGPGSVWRGWRVALLAVAALAGVGLPLAAPGLPLDDVVTRLGPGTTAKDLQLLEVLPELAAGPHVVLIGDLTSRPCTEIPASFLAWRESRGEAPVWVLQPAAEMSRGGGAWLCVPGAEVVDMPRLVLRPLYRTLPRSFEIEDGVVVRTWNGFPE